MPVHSSTNPVVHLPMQDKQRTTFSAKEQDGPPLVPEPGRAQPTGARGWIVTCPKSPSLSDLMPPLSLGEQQMLLPAAGFPKKSLSAPARLCTARLYNLALKNITVEGKRNISALKKTVFPNK